MVGQGCLGAYCAYVSGSRHPASDEDVCADLGVCSERIVSDDECAAGEGVWLVIGGERLCYLKWSTVREDVIWQMRDICLDDGGVWDGREMRCRRDCLAWNVVDGCIPLEESE